MQGPHGLQIYSLSCLALALCTMWSAQCRAFCISSANEGSTGSGEPGVHNFSFDFWYSIVRYVDLQQRNDVEAGHSGRLQTFKSTWNPGLLPAVPDDHCG
ncbi:hypothetical protein PspLS_03603 [Pyricularia sp. CBS 133598]|nr:hypothetical protein PspLS_03603 [Pyricularia sp. CBS 133598]